MKLDFLHPPRWSSSPILSRRCKPPAAGGRKTDETGRFCIRSAAANCLRFSLLASLTPPTGCRRLNNRWNLDFCLLAHVILTWHKPFNLIWFLKQIIS
jgi:hypothetical protein